VKPVVNTGSTGDKPKSVQPASENFVEVEERKSGAAAVDSNRAKYESGTKEQQFEAEL
jgi:hypothetical protein